MVSAEVLATYYSFLLVILTFLATKYLGTLDEIRKLIVENPEKFKDKKNYEVVSGTMKYKKFIGFVIVIGILINSFLLINVVFPDFIIPVPDLALIVIIIGVIILIFLEQIVNISKVLDTAHKDNIDEVIDDLTKK